MADNTLLNLGTGGDTIASDDIAGVKFQRIKLIYGGDGVNSGDVSTTNALPNAMYDKSNVGIDSLSAGTGANGLLTAQGATNFFVSTANSTTAQLAASATFNGTIESVLSAPYCSIILDCDQPGLLTVKQYITSSAGTQVINTSFVTAAKSSGVCFGRSFAINGNYISVSFQNTGASTTTTLNLNVAYGNIDATTQLLNNPVSLNEVNGTPLSLGFLNTLPVASPTATATASFTAASQSVIITLNGSFAQTCFDISGTGVGMTLTVEAAGASGVYGQIIAHRAGDNTLASTITANDLYRCTTAGFSTVRLTAAALASGTVTVNVLGAAATSGVFLNLPLPAGTNTIGGMKLIDTAGTNVGTIKAASTAVASGDTALAVGFHPSSPLPTGSNTIGTVNPPTITKGTQGSIGITTQDLKDAGRNPVHFYTVIPVLTSATDTLQSLTGTKSGATVTATTTPAVVTSGKTFRVTCVAATYVATATAGYGVVRLRFNTAGVVAITSPVAATITVGAGTPATANSVGVEDLTLSDGWEFAAGTGVGISVQGFAAVTATAVGYVTVSMTGYEY